VMARGAGGRIVFSVGAAVISLAAVFTMAWADPGRAEAWEKGRIFLWSVAGEKGTLHLLGSIHALKDDAYPLDDRIEQAYAKSVRVVFEADQEETAGTEMQKELVERGTYTGDTTLKDHISKDTCRLLEEKAHAAGLDIAKLQRLRPWLCAVSLSAMEMARMGFSPENGIDAHYAARAKKDGKERVFLESARLQVDLLAGMPEDLQEEFLRQALRELEVIREKSAVLAAAWKSGDVRALEEIVSISLNEHPKVRKDLFTERNEQWVSHLEELMKARGDTLVIVGAGHLVGDDGILSLLRRKGFGPVQQ